MTSEAQCLARLAQARQALRDGMEGEALAHARQAAEWFPDALVVRMTLGFALSANGLHDAAELVFKQAREHDPAAVRAYCTRLGATPHEPLLLDSRAIHLAHDFARRRACDWRSHDYLQRFADWIDHAPSRASCQPVSNYKGAVSTACKLVFVAGHGTFRGTEQTLKSRASWVVRSPSVRQESWRGPAGESPAQVRGSARLVASVASWSATATTKRTQRLHGVWD